MAKKNRRKTKRKSSGFIVNAVCNTLCYGIYVALIIVGIAMIYHWGFPFVDVTNYHIICAGSILILIGLILLTAGRIPDIVSTFLAAFLLITIGILHPVTLFLAACGVYIIVDKILIMTGHKELAEKIGNKISSFMYKLVKHKLHPDPEYMEQSARNKAMGIKKVKDVSKQKKNKQEDSNASVTTTEAQVTASAADTQPQGDVAFPYVQEPDRAASEAMARPDPGQFITNFAAGFIFTMGGIMSTLPTLVFLPYSNILEQLPFLLFGGTMLAIGIWQLVKGFKTYKQYSRKQ